MNLSPLVLEAVLLMLTVTQEDPRPIPEPNFLRDDLDVTRQNQRRQEDREPLRALHVVLYEIVIDPAEQVNLKARDEQAEQDRQGSHEEGLPSPGGPAVQDLSRYGLQCLGLLGSEVNV